jgi:hypothetical protein
MCTTEGTQCPVLQGLGSSVTIKPWFPRPKDGASNNQNRNYGKNQNHNKEKRNYDKNQNHNSKRFSEQHSPPFILAISGLHSHVDETAIENSFQDLLKQRGVLRALTAPFNVSVQRKNNNNKNSTTSTSAAASDDIDEYDDDGGGGFSVVASMFRGSIPLADEAVATSFFHPNSSVAGYYLQYSSLENARLAAIEWNNKTDESFLDLGFEEARKYHGQPIRFTTKFSGVVTVVESIWNHFRSTYDDLIQSVLVKYNTTCRMKKAEINVDVVGRPRNEKVSFILVAKSPAQLNFALTDLRNALKMMDYTPRNEEEKAVLFSLPARASMSEILTDKSSYLFWVKIKRVYYIYLFNHNH